MTTPERHPTLHQVLMRYKDAPGVHITERGGKQRTWNIPDAVGSQPYPKGIDGLDLDQEVLMARDGSTLYVQILIMGQPLPDVAYVIHNVPIEPLGG